LTSAGADIAERASTWTLRVDDSLLGRVEARPQHEDALAADLGERPADAVTCRGDPPGPHLPLHLLRGTRPVDLGVLRLEEARVAHVVLDLGVAGIVGLRPLERTRQQRRSNAEQRLQDVLGALGAG
jgi:hypothetical protein